MLSTEDQISILVHLSKADKVIAEEEYRLIIHVAEGLGMSSDNAAKIINDPNPIPVLKNLPPDEKFEYLLNVVKLMKADGKIHQKEVSFCEKLAFRLGYKPGVISELSAYIYRDPNINTNRAYLRSIVDQHLIPMNESDE
ncbi:MAG: TerB family tellurite resistance protein [Cyclobacteriaceae bacterium]